MFANIAALVTARGWQGKVSGVLLDLGVSSPQLDRAERGLGGHPINHPGH